MPESAISTETAIQLYCVAGGGTILGTFLDCVMHKPYCRNDHEFGEYDLSAVPEKRLNWTASLKAAVLACLIAACVESIFSNWKNIAVYLLLGVGVLLYAAYSALGNWLDSVSARTTIRLVAHSEDIAKQRQDFHNAYTAHARHAPTGGFDPIAKEPVIVGHRANLRTALRDHLEKKATKTASAISWGYGFIALVVWVFVGLGLFAQTF